MQQIDFALVIPVLIIPLLLLLLWRIGLRRLKIYHSPLLGKIEVFKKYNGEKVLTINSYGQGISIDKKSIAKSYWYKIAQEAVKFCQNKKHPQVLMLGLGANTISSLIGKMNPQIHQTIVEFDGYIIEACKKYFGLDKLPKFDLVQDDVYKLVDRKNVFKKPFDVLIVDVFTGKPPFISLKSNEPSFIEKNLPWLKKDGMILFNRPGNTESARTDSQKLREYLSTLFKKTGMFDIKDPRGYRNNVITGFFKKLA